LDERLRVGPTADLDAETNIKHKNINTRVYPKVTGLAGWRENCKWYSSLPLGAVASLLSESV